MSRRFQVAKGGRGRSAATFLIAFVGAGLLVSLVGACGGAYGPSRSGTRPRWLGQPVI